MFRFQFTSTLEDLLEAKKAEEASKGLRAPFRWMIVSFGFALVAGGIIAFGVTEYWRHIVWLGLGLGVIHFFAIRPFLASNRIRKRNAVSQDLTLEFNEDSLIINVNGVGKFIRIWEELVHVDVTARGFLFYFSDGVVNWLPDRVFEDEMEKSGFISFIQNHHPQMKRDN